MKIIINGLRWHEIVYLLSSDKKDKVLRLPLNNSCLCNVIYSDASLLGQYKT